MTELQALVQCAIKIKQTMSMCSDLREYFICDFNIDVKARKDREDGKNQDT